MSIGDEMLWDSLNESIKDLEKRPDDVAGHCGDHGKLATGVTVLLKIERARMAHNGGTVARKAPVRNGSAPAPPRQNGGRWAWLRYAPAGFWRVLAAVLGVTGPAAVVAWLIWGKG